MYIQSLMHIEPQSALPDSLLKTYRGGRQPERWGQYGDCFSVRVDRPVRLERRILRWVVGAASTDAQAQGVANGTADVFAAWAVGARSESQLLMCDRYEATRSWFRVVPTETGTTLQFGSAVASVPGSVGGRSRAAAKRLLSQPSR